jgi:F0F1-type ATP synthase alpha subunit
LFYLGGDLMGHQVIFPDGTVGVIVTHRAPVVFVYCDMDQLGETEGTVKVLDSLASLTVSDGVKISDCFGRALKEGSSPDGKVMKRAIFAAIPQVKDIALINTPMVTGVTMLDALAPIGKGQNMLMIGHDLKDMRGYVVDLLSAQKGKTKCIYAATTDKDEITTMLVEAGLLDVVLVAQDGKADKDEASGAAESTTIAAAACAIGESFALEKGENALVIIDTIDQHKKLWDSTTRVLVDVFGIDAVVKGDLDGGASSEMRAFYSTLIQRSAQYKKNRGGGSVTVLLMTTIPKLAGGDDGTVYYPSDFENSSAKTRERIDLLAKKNIPLTAATLRKIEIPIPSDTEGKRRLVLQHVDDLISMSDGQIWFDEKLEAGGRRPPMDPTRSVTRVGIGADTPSRADAPAMRRVVEGLRLNLAQAASMDGADFALTSSQKQLRKSNALLLAMHQEAQSGARMLSESCTVLLAATKGHLDGTVDKGIVAGSAEGDKIISDLLKHVSSTAPGALAEIDETEDMSEDCMKEIEAAIESFFSSN